MLPATIRKTWRDDRRAVIGWAAAAVAFTSVYTGFYSQFRELAQAKQEALPEGVLDALGIENMATPTGYLQATVFSLVGPLLMIMCALMLATRSIAAPEEGGELELLLSGPVSRRGFAVQRLAAACAGTAIVAAMVWATLMVIVPAIDMDLPLSHVTAACAGLLALAWCFTGVAFLAGAAAGRRGHAFAVAGVLAGLAYFANAAGELLDSLDWMVRLSPFHYFIGVDPLNTGWHWGALALLVGVGAVTSAVGVILFDGRDLGV
jgi:ABC-2 type transport system permease protein